MNKRIALWGIPVVVILAGAAMFGFRMMAPPPADLDYSTTQTSENGSFTATIEPSQSPIAINQIHTWTIGVTMADGTPAETAAISVDGGMPQHGHGLPTNPQVTRDLGDGKFEVEGMKFNMSGWWIVKIHVGDDTATFNLSL